MNVLIVGAGIAGPTLGYWLVEAGHRVTLMERAPQLRRGGYLVDFWGAGFDVARRMRIVPELERLGYSMTAARAVDRKGRRFASIRLEGILRAGEGYVSIARCDLAATIVSALAERAELLLGDPVASIDERLDGVSVTFDTGVTRDFDLVFGADGLHSRVRRLCFGPDELYERYQGIVAAVYDVTGYPYRDELVAIMHAEPGFQIVRVSLRDDVTMVIVTMRHDGPVPRMVAEQQELVRSSLAGAGWETKGLLDAMPEATSFYFDSVSQIVMPAWSKGRVALVGDAAAAPSLLAGQGSAMAMVEAYVLAGELASSPADHDAAFERYHARLAEFIASKQGAARGLGVAFAPTSRLQLLVRDLVMRLMAVRMVADLAMGKSFHDAFELPDYPALTAAGNRG